MHACSGTSCANRHIIERMTSSPFGLKQHILKTARTAGGDDRYREQESFAFHEMIFISMHKHTHTHAHTHTCTHTHTHTQTNTDTRCAL